MKRFILVAAVSSMTALAASSANAQSSEDIYCDDFYPDATYEQLLVLCEGDVQPGPTDGGNGGDGNEYPGYRCGYATRLEGAGDCHPV